MHIFVMHQVACYVYHKWFSCKAVRLLGQLLTILRDHDDTMTIQHYVINFLIVIDCVSISL